MGHPQANPLLDFPAYLIWEAEQEERHEYHLGEVFAMVGARIPHNTVSLNIAAALKSGLRGTPCRTHIDGTKLRIEAADAVLYPDVVVSCDARDRGPEDRFLCHPLLVVEVLSEATAAYDRGPKFALYRQLASLREYVLVDVERRRVEAFRLGADGHWVLHDFTGTDFVEFASVGQNLAMTTVFEDIDLPQA
jgi:Uma2 family endonuclease